MPRQRSHSHEIPSNSNQVHVLSRALSYDTATLENNDLLERKHSFHVHPTVFCRQSTLVQEAETEANEENVEKAKLIKNPKQMLILVAMALIEFSGTLGMSVISPFFPSEAKKKDTNQTIVGLIFAIHPLIIFLLSPVAGKWMPRIGVKFCLIAGCFLEGGTEILFGFVDDLPKGAVFIIFSFVIRAVTAVGTSLSTVASLSILTVTFKDHIGTVFGVVELFTGLGFMTGPAIGGVLYQYGGFKLPFLVSGGFVLLVQFAVFCILPAEEAYHVHVDGKEGEEEVTPIFDALRIPGIIAIGIGTVTAGMTLSFFDPTLSPFLKHIDPKITTEQIGLIFVILPGIYTFIAPLVGYIADTKVPGRVCIIIGQVGLCVGYFLIGPSPFLENFIKSKVWLVIVSCAIMGLFLAPFVVPTLTDMQKSGRNGGLPATLGTDSLISGLFNGFFSIGSVIGPTLGSVISQKWSFEGACFIFSCMFLAEAIFLSIFTLWERKSKWGGRRNGKFESLQEEC